VKFKKWWQTTRKKQTNHMKSKYLNRSGQFLLAAVCSALCIGSPAMAASPVGDIVGKTVVGYQGWFSGLNDGSPNGNWSHYANSGTPNATNVLIVSWPDVGEFTTTYQTAFANLGNGQPATLFSPEDQQTVDTQFRWMQQNGIDGAALQRFGSWITPGSTRKAQVDGIATRVMSAAQTAGRKFLIMYDCSATDATVADWTNTIVNTLHLTSSGSYAKQNGKPVVCLWGVCKSGRGSNHDWTNTINAFKAQGCYVIGGVLHTWTNDRVTNGVVYNDCNCIQPWVIGAEPGGIAGADSFYTRCVVPDMAYCASNGLDYQLSVAPGGVSDGSRLHGDFMWEQFYNAVRGGVQGIYISMYDEFNEGNQIAKTAEDSSMIPTDAPAGLNVGLNQDGTACSSDYYLRLTGDGNKMLKGQIALTNVRPTPPMNRPANGTYKAIVRHSGLALDVDHQSITNGSPIQQWTYNAGNNQRWTLARLSGSVYKITGVQSGRVLEVPGSSTANGTLLDIRDSNNGLNQKWTITPTDSGYYSVVNVNSGKSMEVLGGVGALTNGAPVDQWSGFQNNQQWTFQAP